MFRFLNRSINVEGHGLAIGALVNMFCTDVINAATTEAAPLGIENRHELRRFHEAVGVRLH